MGPNARRGPGDRCARQAVLLLLAWMLAWVAGCSTHQDRKEAMKEVSTPAAEQERDETKRRLMDLIGLLLGEVEHI